MERFMMARIGRLTISASIILGGMCGCHGATKSSARTFEVSEPFGICLLGIDEKRTRLSNKDADFSSTRFIHDLENLDGCSIIAYDDILAFVWQVERAPLGCAASSDWGKAKDADTTWVRSEAPPEKHVIHVQSKDGACLGSLTNWVTIGNPDQTVPMRRLLRDFGPGGPNYRRESQGKKR